MTDIDTSWFEDHPALPDHDDGSSDHLTVRQFRVIAEFIERMSGIRMPPSKQVMVEGRLRRRARELGMQGVADYGAFLLDHGGLDAESVHVIDAVTTNKTDFFREPDHFRFLCDPVLPTLLRERRPGARESIKVWSAACSTGAEVYTLAMVLADALSGTEKWSVLGTDISTDVLQRAVEAIYPTEMAEPIPPAFRKRYLLRPRDPDRRVFRIVPELRRQTCFRQVNLMDPHYPVDDDMDIIFCRNVLIYFDRPTQHRVLQQLSRHLRPGGLMFLGHSESMAGSCLEIRQVFPTIFQR